MILSSRFYSGVLMTLALFLISSVSVMGQFESDPFPRDKTKGFSRVISTTIYPKEVYRTVSYINAEGDITKKENYVNAELTGWQTFTYFDGGIVRSIKSYRQIFSYNDVLKRDTTYLGEDYSDENVHEYKEGKLARVVSFRNWFGNRSCEAVRTLDYDSQGRLIREVYTDSTEGFKGTFLANSTEIDTMYEKLTVEQTIITHAYHGNKIITTSRDELGEVWQYVITQLGTNGKPSLKTIKDNNNRDLIRTSYHYDSRGRLYKTKRELLNVDLINFDYSAEDEMLIQYNDRSLPVKIVYREKGKVISETTIKYIR